MGLNANAKPKNFHYWQQCIIITFENVILLIGVMAFCDRLEMFGTKERALLSPDENR